MRTDPLSDVLRLARPRTASYDRGVLHGAWGIRLLAVSGATFCALTSGETWFGGESIETQSLSGGDVILIPHGQEVWLCDTPGRLLDPPAPGRPFARHVSSADHSPATIVMAGIIEFDGLADVLLSALPPAIRYRPTPSGHWLAETLRLLDDELEAPRPGGSALVAQLFATLFTQMLRSLLDSGQEAMPAGLMRGLRDPSVAACLMAVHGEPAAPWTVETMAEAACLSRTAFAERFKACMGEAPMHYVRGYRMRRAAVHLQSDPSLTIDELALEAGYDSTSSFTKAFQRIIGHPPGAYRDLWTARG